MCDLRGIRSSISLQRAAVQDTSTRSLIAFHIDHLKFQDRPDHRINHLRHSLIPSKTAADKSYAVAYCLGRIGGQ